MLPTRAARRRISHCRAAKSECEIHINLMYFGGNDKFKNLLRLKCSKFSKGAETALKSTYPARSSKVVFAHDGASMPAAGIDFSGGYYSLSKNKLSSKNFKSTTELQILRTSQNRS